MTCSFPGCGRISVYCHRLLQIGRSTSDHFHGVCHARFQEAVAELTRQGGYLGMLTLVDDMLEVQRYRAATESVFALMPNNVSIVSSSILLALAGQYGDVHATGRTQGSHLWISPLMAAYWCFRLDRVAERILYREAMLETNTYLDINQAIADFRRPARRFGRRSPFPYEGMPRRPTGLD